MSHPLASPTSGRIDLPCGFVAYTTAGSGEPLLVHGLGGTRHTWRYLVEKLAATHTVIAPDLPGHGDSEVPGGDFGPQLNPMLRAATLPAAQVVVAGLAHLPRPLTRPPLRAFLASTRPFRCARADQRRVISRPSDRAPDLKAAPTGGGAK
ncbi:alpha/beta fold hydrolase [Phytohabitans houttuyneae]|uniref:AB hydrolase-1 domain-containing protein n=1 Tax=Phytohabitans houttuyneae TaxID=1076126 RepID=A0A6V8KRX6_9ACTN|nr:alpha/beta fold hydrolase [Phytohabitans houttuyneae]GFJ85101.1 hypothetical protein Phou_092810 [Phytohabitans houttuyneae]